MRSWTVQMDSKTWMLLLWHHPPINLNWISMLHQKTLSLCSTVNWMDKSHNCPKGILSWWTLNIKTLHQYNSVHKCITMLNFFISGLFHCSIKPNKTTDNINIYPEQWNVYVVNSNFLSSAFCLSGEAKATDGDWRQKKPARWPGATTAASQGWFVLWYI